MERQKERSLSAPLWAIALAAWIIAIVSIVGAVKVYQMQESLRDEIQKIPKLPRIRL